MVRRYTALAIAALVWSKPAHSHELYAVIPSGQSEVNFALSLSDTLSRIKDFCRSAGYPLEQEAGTQLTCGIPENDARAMTELMPAEQRNLAKVGGHLLFKLAAVENATQVQALAWVYGSSRNNEPLFLRLNTVSFQNQIVYLLGKSGGQLPANTAFPNHATLGVTGEQIPWHAGEALQVSQVLADSPAGNAGIRPGDAIFQIAGLRWHDFNGYLDAMAKAVEQPSYEVVAERRGKHLTFDVGRVFRGPVIPAGGQADRPLETLAGK